MFAIENRIWVSQAAERLVATNSSTSQPVDGIEEIITTLLVDAMHKTA